jgi:5-oxoprolinase (ATP-hydrolysing)
VAAVSLLNSWKSSLHEEAVAGILREAGFSTVCTSATIRPLIHYLQRTETVLVEAMLSPLMEAYLDGVGSALGEAPFSVMSSAGGLMPRKRFRAVDSLVSGPAGGLMGAVACGRRAGLNGIIALDMGGTSTDVSRWKGRAEPRQRVEVGAVRLLAPTLPIETVAAGGGSICGFDGECLFVGPESAGADPGPAAYGSGGPLTLTDVHLLLGRMDTRGFSIPVRVEAAREAMQAVARQAGVGNWLELAEGFLAIANERMGQAVRKVSLREGEDPAAYGLVAFGGAGGLHACRLADELGIKEILIPADAGILRARGIHFATREVIRECQVLEMLDEAEGQLGARFESLAEEARVQLKADGVQEHRIGKAVTSVYLRLFGQESSLPVDPDSGIPLEEGFRARFTRTFGYYPEHARLEVVKLRVKVEEMALPVTEESFQEEGDPTHAVSSLSAYVQGRRCQVPVHDRALLAPDAAIEGPAVISDTLGATFLEDGWGLVVGSAGSLRLRPLEARTESAGRDQKPDVEMVRASLIQNRFEGLVEEMGEQLRRTALSPNIRERLDFSCALLDTSGRLLVNAPHIPVHLGALGLCVRSCLEGRDFRPGDILVTNHPAHGGSHLPDVTLLCGVFTEDGKIAAYLANRAHHAEFGGKAPGSMPTDAANLAEEGVILEPQWLVRKGEGRFPCIEKQLRTALWPSRAVRDNLIDLEAQVASLQRGADLFSTLLKDEGVERISRVMERIFASGAGALERFLGQASSRQVITTESRLDDGGRIRLTLETRADGIDLDFTGTLDRHPGNLNATPAIVRSAVLYVLRLLVDAPIPLNEGLLERVAIRLPTCFLNPDFSIDPQNCPAVVGGNVETSQLLVETLLKAFGGVMASSQGTMNNLLFGNERFGYYETIGGGSGAGPGFTGASGVHVHMTNTAITDPEILEQRFPVLCRAFSLRRSSGGAGQFRGGDGLVRELVFREPVHVSFLSQGRQQAPMGADGGGPGSPGRQWRRRVDGALEAVDGICQLHLKAGEGFRVETPGGGGWGLAAEADKGH